MDVLVSIIIPTRNRKELLFLAVQSVLHQTHKNIQIVVHDNNSTDGTEEFLKKRVSDERLEYYRSDVDLSMTENWNKAFSYIKGVYFVRLDDDNVFLNDFIESCLDKINREKCDVVTYSPLIIHWNRKNYTTFDIKGKDYFLKKLQSFYFEYFSLTDSNYTLYEVALLKKLFPDGSVYQTTLPDRYMNYLLLSKVNDLKICFNTSLKGATRFDYRAPVSDDYILQYIDYSKMISQEILNLKDCQNNFSMHRINTIKYFFQKNVDREMKDFFEKKITAPALYATVMKMGHISRTESVYSFEELMVYNKYALEILVDIISHPLSVFEGKNVFVNLVAITKNITKGILLSLKNILLKKKRKSAKLKILLGDEIVKKIISGQDIIRYSQSSGYGDVQRFLDKVRC